MDGTSGSGSDQGGYNIGYGPSKDKMFYILVFYVGAIGMGILYLIWKLRGYNRPDTSFDQVLAKYSREDSEPTTRVNQRQDGPRKRRNIQSKIQNDLQSAGLEEQGGGSSSEESSGEETKPTEKIGAKKLKKMQEKEERRKMREAMEIERADRRKRQEEEERIRKIAEEKEKEIEKLKEEEERKAKEQKEKEEHELYLEMKKAFEVNEVGQDAFENEEQQQNKLQEFVNYLKEKKVVLLEDLASHFGLRTKDAIDRVQDLLKDEIITGVIDDRGKFIYITPEELQSVATFVKQRGRVAISEIAAASNRLINLSQEPEVSKSVS